MYPLLDQLKAFMDRGGWVMWPLLALSGLAVALVFERVWFWAAANNPFEAARVRHATEHLRRGNLTGAMQVMQYDRSVYARVVHRLVHEGATDDVAADAIESQRSRMERFMPTLSTVITAAPLLGILGTVTGIIDSFRLLSDQTSTTDPRAVSQGIAEALLTTASGLTVAIVVLFPYNGFRAQIDRTLGRLESLAGAARSGAAAQTPPAGAPPAGAPPAAPPADNA